jgi:hypothetical protein
MATYFRAAMTVQNWRRLRRRCLVRSNPYSPFGAALVVRDRGGSSLNPRVDTLAESIFA